MPDDSKTNKKRWLFLLIPLVTVLVGVPAALFPRQCWNFLRGKGERLGLLESPQPMPPADDSGESPLTLPSSRPQPDENLPSDTPSATEPPSVPDEPPSDAPELAPSETPLTMAEAEAQLAELAQGLSESPCWRLCLAQDQPLLRLVRLCDDLANGSRPLASLDFLRQTQPFAAARTADGRLVVSQATKERYSACVQMFASLPALPLAKLYLTLEPALQEACEALGYRDVHVRSLVTAAANHILVIPQLDAEPSLVQQGPGLYVWESPELEKLTPAQKLLLRLGQENVRLVRNKVEELGTAIGLWEE
jgi:hypothetical protein